MQISSIIQYFRACYQADQREQNIWNIFDKNKIEHLQFFSGDEELLTAEIPKRYIDKEDAQNIQKTLQLFRKEKQLYYFTFFITGKTESEFSSRKQITAPLFYYPAEIFEEDNDFYFKIDFERQQINYPLISALDNIEHESYENALFEALPSGEIDYLASQNIIKALKPYLTTVSFEQSYRYSEELLTEEEVRSFSRKHQLYFLPASCLGVMATSKNTRGVLTELEQITDRDIFSNPLKALFTPKNEIENNNSENKSEVSEFQNLVPTILSESQNNVLKQAHNSTLSLVIGPPGTGKSYTIASLAVDAMQRGKSVLIASRNNPAVDVVADKIEKQLGIKGCTVRGGSKNYLNDLKKFIESLLSGAGLISNSNAFRINKELVLLEEELKEINQGLELSKQTFEKQTIQDINYANYLVENQDVKNIFKKFWINFKKGRIKSKTLKKPSLSSIYKKLQDFTDKKNQKLKTYIQLTHQIRLRQLVKNNRLFFSRFSQALRARRDSKQEELFKQIDFDFILQAFPIWLVNLADIYDILPLQREMFDIAIIDEASQCDVSSTLPILYRAKKVVIVGDNKQLRHISFLSKAKQQKLQSDFNLNNYDSLKLNYRELSVLDLVSDTISDQSQVSFLDEHFRSLPDIITFSNQKFYNNALHIMTQNPHNIQKKGLELVDCQGLRDKRGWNEQEANFIIEKIKTIAENEQEIKNNLATSIGVLSPFRSQVDFISKEISTRLSLDIIEKHQIEIGTAHAFQGNERDTMFISWVVDNASVGGSFNHINKADIFNVAITRARTKQYILTSVSEEKLKQNSLLWQYLTYLKKEQKTQENTKQLTNRKDFAFANEVIEVLEKKGFTCQIAYPIAGLQLDLVIQKDGQSLGIDLIGYPDDFVEAFSLERYEILQRAGLDMLPLSYTQWIFNQEKAIESITTFFE